MNYEKAKKVNKCKRFLFNPIDVLYGLKTYKPRKKNDYKKQKLF